MEGVLVCLLGATRAHELTFPSFKRQVLDELSGDLAMALTIDEIANAGLGQNLPLVAEIGAGPPSGCGGLAREVGHEPDASTEWIQMKSLLRSHPRRITIIEPCLVGHRADQLIAISSLLSDHDICADHQTQLWPHVLTRNPLLFPTIDGSLLTFLIVAPIRTLLLRRTVAIWHRPKTSTRRYAIRQYAKYYCVKLIKYFPLVALISVQKPQLQPEISALCTDWIYQISQWYKPSIMPEDSDRSTGFAALIRQHAKGRPIIIYLGEIASEKGFEFFSDLLVEDASKCRQFAFVAAGKINPCSAHAAHQFLSKGGMVVDRYLSDSEFLTGIDVADWVWNCYQPNNDQNSGIFGRAYLEGAKVIVRHDSYIARAAFDLRFPTVQIQYGDARGALEAIRASRTLMVEKPKQEIINLMKERTRERLLYYLGC